MNRESAAVLGRVGFADLMVVSLWVAAPKMTDVAEVVSWLRVGGAALFLGVALIAGLALRCR